jgi:SAM-dependent methyltransferase
VNDVSIWDRVWKDTANQEPWTYLSQIIHDNICATLGADHPKGSLEGALVLEAGCGTGRIAKSLVDTLNVRALYLDYSAVAVSNLRQGVPVADRRHILVQGDIFDIPLVSGSCDVVWNAGVIEHFVGEAQRRALAEMIRVTKPGGVLITLNPYAGSLLHTIGKRFVETVTTYPYGEEIPITTLVPMANSLGYDVDGKEYSMGFIVLFVGMFKRLMIIPGLSIFRHAYELADRTFLRVSTGKSTGRSLERLDRTLARLFGGYLLVTVIRKPLAEQHTPCP